MHRVDIGKIVSPNIMEHLDSEAVSLSLVQDCSSLEVLCKKQLRGLLFTCPVPHNGSLHISWCNLWSQNAAENRKLMAQLLWFSRRKTKGWHFFYISWRFEVLSRKHKRTLFTMNFCSFSLPFILTATVEPWVATISLRLVELIMNSWTMLGSWKDCLDEVPIFSVFTLVIGPPWIVFVAWITL